MILKHHETWDIQDPSKIQSYMSCPREYFFEYVLGWRLVDPNRHLIVGTGYHLAMEKLLTDGYTAEGCFAAYEAFEEYYRRFFGPDMDEVNAPKNPGNVLRALPAYCNAWPDDHFDVLKIEVAFSVPIDENRVIYGKMDTICHDERGFFSLEHKTGSRFSTAWAAEWQMKMQPGAYTHVLCSLFPPEEVYGIVVNGTFLKNPPKLKKDGTPYANSSDTEFHRVPVRRNTESMASWLDEVNFWMDQIDRDFNLLQIEDEDAPVMTCFRRNPESCTKYGICPYHDYCRLWQNPLAHADAPPLGFHVERWDPRTIETIKETVKL